MYNNIRIPEGTAATVISVHYWMLSPLLWPLLYEHLIKYLIVVRTPNCYKSSNTSQLDQNSQLLPCQGTVILRLLYQNTVLLFWKMRILSGLNLVLARQGTAGLELVSEEQIRNRIKYKFGAEIFQEKCFKEAWQQEQELLSVSMLCHLEQAGLFTEVPVSAGNVQNTQNPKSLKEQTAKIYHYGQSFGIKRGIYVSIR